MRIFRDNYYCLIAGLPDLLLDEGKVHFTLREFRNSLPNEVSGHDYKLTNLIFLRYDNQNLLNLLGKKEEPHHDLGNYSAEMLEDETREPTGKLPGYMAEFIRSYHEKSPVYPELSWENQLETLFYDYLIETRNDFLKDWFIFDLNLNNVITALNCRKFKIPVENHLIGNNPVTEAIHRSNSRDFGLSAAFDQIEYVLNAFENTNLTVREKQLDMLRWNWLDDHTFFHYFTIEKVISFLIKLQITERWLFMDKTAGKEIFVKLLADLGKSYELPEEFTLRKKF